MTFADRCDICLDYTECEWARADGSAHDIVACAECIATFPKLSRVPTSPNRQERE